MSNWDQQFDFDELDVKANNKKTKDKKKKKIEQDDFMDLEDQTSKPNKLPTINNKSSAQNNNKDKDKNNKKSKNVYDDYQEIYEEVEEVPSPKKAVVKKSLEESNYYEELQEVSEVRPKKESNVPKIENNVSKSYEEDFYEEVEEIKSPVRQTKRIEPKSPKRMVVSQEPQPLVDEDNYEQSFDDYGDDFEVQVKDVPKKSLTSANLKAKDKNLRQSDTKNDTKKKYSVNANQIFTNKNTKDTKTQPAIPKQPQKQNKLQTRNASKKTIERSPGYGVSQPKQVLQRSDSRKSFKSNESRSRIGNSRVTKKYLTEFTSNKHILLVEKTFPQDENKLKTMTIDRLSKINEHIREMIRKFNDELNDLINKNMILLKDKPVQKDRNSDDKMRVLHEQLRSGATALEVIQNEYERLKGREGELKEQEYILIMQKRVEQIKEDMKQTAKAIHKLKVDVNSQGNKLSRKDVQRRMAQELHQIKTMLMNVKKDEERQQSKLQKLEKMLVDLESKNSDKDYQLGEQIDQAKQKGITLNVRHVLMKKYDDLKLKVSVTQNHCKGIEALNKNKGEHIHHERDQIRIAVRNIESQIKNICHSIQHSQDESVKFIKKVKQNPKIAVHIAQTLDNIMKAIEESQQNSYFDVKSEGNKSQASQRPLKKSVENNSKQKPPRINSSKKQPEKNKPQTQTNDQINLLKPNFMKKKVKKVEEEDETNQLYQRVWSEKEEKKQKQEEEERKKKQATPQEDRKKPFTLKKHRLKNQEKSFDISPKQNEEPTSQKITIPAFEPLKQEQKPTLGPKFTRFSRRGQGQNEVKHDFSLDKPEVKQEPKKVAEEIPKQEPPQQVDQPIFKPKRFNMRNRLQKKDDSYIPSVEAKVQEKKEEPQQYVPKMSFKNEDVYKIPAVESKIVIKEVVAQEIKIDEPEIKPRFMLKLKDRQKKQAGSDSYMPSSKAIQPEVKPEKKFDSVINPTREPVKQQKPMYKSSKPEDSYVPSSKNEQNKFSIGKQSAKIEPVNNPYAPKQSVSNPYAPKEPVNNPYAPAVKQQKPVNNPYASMEDAPKRQKEGPVKKIKIKDKAPKEKINIYQQAQDLTSPRGKHLDQPVNQPIYQPPTNINLAKTDELDLNAMLGKQKKKENNDYGDLLLDAKVEKKKDKKKNANDFFNDLVLD